MQMTPKEWQSAIAARTSQAVFERLATQHVAIAGLGGLGSHIALMLARSGVGELTLIDFDCVEASNLNRQAYRIAQIGQPKTEALRELLHEIAPWLRLHCHQVRLHEHNTLELLAQAPLLCEALDGSESKAMLINTLLEHCPHMRIVAASGMAGTACPNEIQTRRAMRRLYLCGDGHSDIADQLPLIAARVQLCAAHQAHTLIRLMLGELD